MKRFFSAQLSVCLRTILFFGLLNGLLFSSGEGIRLLPFPASQNLQSSNFENQNNQERNYEKNIHRFENHTQTYQLKNQRNADNLSSNSTFFLKFSSFDSTSLQNGRFPEQQTLYLSQLFKRNSASRAPPFI